jgi:putative transposase
MAWIWMMGYNEERPHDSLGKLPPAMYRRKLENSSLEVSQ